MNNTNNLLKIIYCNANGIFQKQQELNAPILNQKIDIIFLCETKLNPKTKIQFTNYITYRTDGTSIPGSCAHCDTAILVNRCIVHKHITLNTRIPSITIEISSLIYITQISAVYKRPGQFLNTNDLDLLTQNSDWFIVTGNLKSKHPLWNSSCMNKAGFVLYHHLKQSNYLVIAPDTPIYYLNIPHHRLDVIDIVLI